MTILLIIMIKRFSLDDLGEEKDIITKPVIIIGYRPGKTGDLIRYFSLLAKRRKYFNHWFVCTYIKKMCHFKSLN